MQKNTQNTTCVTTTNTYATRIDMYNVFLKNNDDTPIDVVLAAINEIFNIDFECTKAIVLKAHEKGRAYINKYIYEYAETLVNDAKNYVKNINNNFYLDFDIILAD
jgi:ATP-dependent Clp protease adapter protein ClpS